MSTLASDDLRALRCVAVVGVAYLLQGIIAAVGVLLLARLAQLGIPLETQAGILASGAIPWLLKLGGALLLDLGPSWPLRVRGLVITGLQACAAMCVWGLASAWGEGASPDSLTAIAVAWVALNFAAALQDVLVDALALDTLAGHQGWTAATMGLGHAIGAGLGPFLISKWIVEHGMLAGLQTTVWWAVGLAALPAVLLWLPGRPERARTQVSARPATPAMPAMPARRKRTTGELIRLLWIPMLFVALTFGGNATSAVGSEFFFQRLQFDYTVYATVLLPLGTLTGIIGALGMGPLVTKLGPARASMIAAAGLGLVWLSFAAAAPLWTHDSTITLLVGGEGLLQAAMMVGLHALALVAAARSPLPTTAFVFAMAALNLSRVLAPLLAVDLVTLGWVGVFAALGLVQMIASAGLWPLRDLADADPPSAPPTNVVLRES